MGIKMEISYALGSTTRPSLGASGRDTHFELGMHIPILKHRKYDKTFEKLLFSSVFAAPWQNSRPSQIYQQCALGHQAPKTAPDGASGAYFQVGF